MNRGEKEESTSAATGKKTLHEVWSAKSRRSNPHPNHPKRQHTTPKTTPKKGKKQKKKKKTTHSTHSNREGHLPSPGRQDQRNRKLRGGQKSGDHSTNIERGRQGAPKRTESQRSIRTRSAKPTFSNKARLQAKEKKSGSTRGTIKEAATGFKRKGGRVRVAREGKERGNGGRES